MYQTYMPQQAYSNVPPQVYSNVPPPQVYSNVYSNGPQVYPASYYPYVFPDARTHRRHNHKHYSQQQVPIMVGCMYIYSCLILTTGLFSRAMTLRLEVVSVDFSDLHRTTVSGTGIAMARGDSWAILDDNDTLTPEPVEKLIEKADQFTESKLMTPPHAESI